MTTTDLRATDLRLTGMSCASCAAKVERSLNKLDGVAASVNFAVEQAHVEHGPDVTSGDLLHAVESTGYRAAVIDHAETAHHGARGEHLGHDLPDTQLRSRLIGSAVLAVPAVLLSMVMAWQFPGWQWLVLVLTTPIVVWGGYPFHKAALNSARHGSATMDTLVSLGTLAAYLWSAAVLLTGTGSHVYFEVAAAVTVFLLFGRYAEAKAKRSAGSALRALLSMGAKDATVLRDGAEVRIPAGELSVGDVVVVRPGERVATDGVVVEGASALDTSAMTGESVPADVRAGDDVLGGAVNTYGRILVRAGKVGADTQLARMARMVADAQGGKAAIQRLADRVSAVFVPVVLVIAAVTLAGWLLTGHSVAAAFTAAVAVLIIACPCALGLATPTAILVGTGRGAQLGVLIKEPRVLETVRGIDTVVLDKTGTVTTGVMRVSAVETVPGAKAGRDGGDVLARAAAVEAASEHPVAAAIVSAARERGLTVAPVTDFANDPGTGVRGVVDGVAVGVARASDSDGRTTVAVSWDGRERGVIRLVDTVKPTSAEAIAELRSMGITPMLLTGDNQAVAARVAAEVGIAREDVIGGVLPSQKADVVSGLRARGRRVAMVGDGVNDSVALATADIGMAMGTGTDAAIEAGDITLVRGDLRTVPTALRLSSRTLRTIKQNLFWAFGYNAAAIPLAALGLLNPMIAGAAMAISSVLVVGNSLRLKRFR
ncbi:MAG: cadmium-translocating P-type ATPase [Actinomycetia bacterium]|nr:cadmium-translocating P-type ATPase [Actinomycetes bacterium]